LIGFVILAVFFTGIVPVYAWLKAFLVGTPLTVVSYSTKEMVFAVVGESLRALIVCYLYPHLRHAGSSLSHAAWFGLVTTALVGSLWLFVGYGSFPLSNPAGFLFNDTIILLVQGLTTGPVLYKMYRPATAGQ
jgi:hypothetical protein